LIIIIGDSWGVGEWGVENGYVSITGPGIGQLLSLTCSVANFSKGNASNSEALAILTNFLSNYKLQPDDDCYWIVTDPIRCIGVQSIIESKTDIDQTIENSLHTSLACANTLATQHNIKLNLIGGLCDLDKSWEKLYQQLNIVVPSWGKLIDKDYPSSMFNFNSIRDLGELIKIQAPKLLNKWMEIADVGMLKNLYWNKTFHPDRNEHRILRDYLYPDFSQYY
jgi:hypothetical protein